MHFPYEEYETLAEPLTVYYPTGEEKLARQVFQSVEKASKVLAHLLDRPVPEVEIVLVNEDDWENAPRSDADDVSIVQPYWTEATQPPSIVVPLEVDSILGEVTPEKFAYLLYHELVLAFLEDDPRPWPEQYPLWADEWQLKFAALWLSQTLDGVDGIVSKDLRVRYPDVLEPEADGKTPITVRGFDWYEDTDPEDYLQFELLLEQFADDLLTNFGPGVLPRFLALYRTEHDMLLSDDVTVMLAQAVGPGGQEWLESLVYF
jgi:hypothetical protein